MQGHETSSPSPTPNDWSVSVKAWARELGFDACRIAEAGPIDPGGRFSAWLARGYHADMAWLARNVAVRLDPRLRLAGARSVVVVARNYYRPLPAQPKGSGRVARYAHGRDYHAVLKKPLVALARRIDALMPGTKSYCCIDSGPVLERAWAARSGIGWIGKNSLVLNRDLGSWFFLGVIVTVIELSPDAPVPAACGTCTACLDACPTQAIVEAGIVDSRRCISYHTIENRGEIPRSMSKDFGDWVFGCDVCQEVCPWNRFTPTAELNDFRVRPEQAFPDLETLAALDDEGIRERYTGTPLLRAKPAGLRRNAAIALENALSKPDSEVSEPNSCI